MVRLLDRRRRLFIATLGLVALIVLVLAAGLSSLEFQENNPLFPGSAGETGPDLGRSGQEALSPLLARFAQVVLAATVALAMALGVIGFIRFRRVRWATLVLLLLVLGLFILQERLQSRLEPPETPADTSLGEEPLFGPVPTVAPPDFVLDPPPLVALALALLIGLTLAVAALFVYRRYAGQAPAGPGTLEELALSAEATAASLRAGYSLADAVLRCYADMCAIVRLERGLSRAQGMTPREFELALQRAGLPGPSLQRLTRLFEQVRYGGEQMSERDRREAVACLEAVAAAARGRSLSTAPGNLRGGARIRV